MTGRGHGTGRASCRKYLLRRHGAMGYGRWKPGLPGGSGVRPATKKPFNTVATINPARLPDAPGPWAVDRNLAVKSSVSVLASVL
jgi:hypothetical protein